MRILVAPDKFKGSLGAAEVAEEIAAGMQEALPEAEIIQLPIADGGEGTARVISDARGGEWHACNVHDAAGQLVSAQYCTIDSRATAVFEISQACGLWRIPAQHRDPVAASSFGTGEMLLNAARRGVSGIIMGLGGSATNDGGFGMARALGFRFFDSDGVELSGRVSGLLRLDRIEPPDDVALPTITAAADVCNPLLGPEGATHVFARQKGASNEEIELLEAALRQLAAVVKRDLGADFRSQAGAGAAGGLGFGSLSFCAAKMRAGFDVVAELIGLEEAVQNADVVVTGEGRLDAQTLNGKAPAGIARLAQRYAKPAHAIVGEFEDLPALRAMFTTINTLTGAEVTTADAVGRAATLLRREAQALGEQLRV